VNDNHDTGRVTAAPITLSSSTWHPALPAYASCSIAAPPAYASRSIVEFAR